MAISTILRIFGYYRVYFLTSFFKPNQLFIELKTQDAYYACPKCHQTAISRYGKKKRTFRDLSIGNRQLYIIYYRHRIKCADCGVLFEHLPFADDYSRYTRRFERYVFELCQILPISDVAKHLNLSWGAVKEIDQKYLAKKYRRCNYKNLRFIAVDEISIGKFHKYLTVVLNLETGQIIYVGKERKKETLDAFFKEIGQVRCHRIKAIAMDCWDPYIASAIEYLGQSKIVFDKFHILKNYSKVIDKVRVNEFSKADLDSREIIKGSRYLLLYNKENLKTENQRHKLQAVLELNENINLSYILKDELRQIWTHDNRNHMEFALNDWIEKAKVSELRPLVDFANMLDHYKYGILNYCEYSISTGKLEGTNNKIKVLKRRAYGFHDLVYFKLKLFDLHNTNSNMR